MVSTPAAPTAVIADALDGAQEHPAIGRVVRRLVPFLFLCYLVAYIDRVNIGFAARDMQDDLGMSDSVYGYGGALFFLGYFLFEIPSNLILQRTGARRWIARIMIGWGLVSMAMMLIEGEWSFYLVRFVLGVAEAGFFPGIVLYLTYWVPERQRARTGALFMTAAPIAMVAGPWLSEALLKLDGLHGLHGWQWLFLVEGLPAVVLGVIAYLYLTDLPEHATWLPASHREWLSGEMSRERAGRDTVQHSGFAVLRDRRVVLLCTAYFMNTLATYGVFLFLPKILREASSYDGFKLAGITAFPFVVALVGMVLIGRHSDTTGERRWHVSGCALTAAAGLVLAAVNKNSVPLIVLSFTLSQLGQRAIQPVFWSIPPAFMRGTAAAAGIAMINAVGNLGGFVGPALIGRLREGSDDYTSGLYLMAAALILEAILVLSLDLPKREKTR
jgi:ACS family tartrate transporter-like MFS transporter